MQNDEITPNNVMEQILYAAQKIFSKGTGNISLDIKQGITHGINPDYLLSLIRMLDINIPASLNANQEEQETLSYILKSLIKNKLFKLGNCEEQSLTCLELASDHNLTGIWINFNKDNHGIVKIHINNQAYYLDPWFKTNNNTGAIIADNPQDFFEYHLDLIEILKQAKIAQQLKGPLGMASKQEYTKNLLLFLMVIYIAYLINSYGASILAAALCGEISFLTQEYKRGPLLLYSIKNGTSNKFDTRKKELQQKRDNYQINAEIEEMFAPTDTQLFWLKKAQQNKSYQLDRDAAASILTMTAKLPTQAVKKPRYYTKAMTHKIS